MFVKLFEGFEGLNKDNILLFTNLIELEVLNIFSLSLKARKQTAQTETGP